MLKVVQNPEVRARMGLAQQIVQADGLTSHQKASMQGIPRSVLLYGVLRGAVLGVAAGFAFGVPFGLVFGPLSALGITLAYALRFSPADDYHVQARPRLSWHVVTASIARGLAIGIAAVVAGVLLLGSRGIPLGLAIGAAVTLAGGMLSTISPFIEWWADHLPPRHLGAFGAILFILGR